MVRGDHVDAVGAERFVRLGEPRVQHALPGRAFDAEQLVVAEEHDQIVLVQRLDDLIVGRLLRINVSLPQTRGGTEIAASPGETLLAELNGEQVGGQAGESAIAIREWMNPR